MVVVFISLTWVLAELLLCHNYWQVPVLLAVSVEFHLRERSSVQCTGFKEYI